MQIAYLSLGTGAAAGLRRAHVRFEDLLRDPITTAQNAPAWRKETAPIARGKRLTPRVKFKKTPSLFGNVRGQVRAVYAQFGWEVSAEFEQAMLSQVKPAFAGF